ncbi:MAG TPA: SpoIIE family protein phosphatase [Terriglobales bacterium]|nr:SpoIIE family protein phosphatase [Terriglobales bacterium]
MSFGGAGTGGETIAGSSVFPSLIFVQGTEERRIALQHCPFSIGRKTENDLVIPDPRVSREHALIQWDSDGFYVVDQNSKHGTYVNGLKIDRHRLQRNDRVEFGVRGEAFLLFDPDRANQSQARQFLSQLSVWKPSTTGTSDLETLTLFLEAARKLNTTSVLDEILVTLIDATLRLTKAERGYVFLRDPEGSLKLAVGRNSKGEPLMDDSTISRSVLNEAASTNKEFLLTDTEAFGKISARESIVAHNLRTIICIPLRKTQVQEKGGATGGDEAELRGVLYLDSKFLAGKLSAVSNDILRTIASEAAGLLENAYLVQAEESAKRYQQELGIAASIQQRLMRVTIPEVSYARVEAKNIPSKDVGGDFFDVIKTDEALSVVVADVSGKGISAALLASILQGMLYAQLMQDIPLQDLVSAANRFICDKIMGEKYATLFIARLTSAGQMEYINCGHVRPLLMSGGEVIELPNSNLPVGLVEFATFEGANAQLHSEDRLVVVTDGVTEAENPAGEFFTSDRLLSLFPKSRGVEDVLGSLTEFCAGVPLNDDCTVLQLCYSGECRAEGDETLSRTM